MSFHPILVTWFLVVFGDEVIKILCNSLFTFLLSKARQAKQKFKVKKIMQTKMTKKYNEVTKILNDPGINLTFHHTTKIKVYVLI